MDTFFSILKKGIVATIFLVFSFSAVYIPHPANNIKNAEAVDIVFDPQALIQDILNYAEYVQLNVTNTLQAGYDALSAGYNYITQYATNSLYVKEYILDGIAWSIAKSVISSMVQSLVSWINSGFKGSPMFVQDLLGTLLETADQVAGQYIQDLGGVGSFLCSPFKLDIQIALAIDYEKSRLNQPVSTCNLSDITGNLQDFLSGAQGSFSSGGGWDDWFDVTSQPGKYTPFGAKLSAEIGMNAAIVNAKGEKLSILEFGQGFLSNEVCEMEYGWSEPREKCYISTPGKTISDALSFNLDSGRQSLITADEIDEIIGALLGQLANAGISGAAGLLGLSDGTGHTYSGFSGGSLANEGSNSIDYNAMAVSMQQALTVQQNFKALATTNEPLLRPINISAANRALDIIADTNASIPTLTNLIAVMNNPASTVAQKNQAISTSNSLKLYANQEYTATHDNWYHLLNQ